MEVIISKFIVKLTTAIAVLILGGLTALSLGQLFFTKEMTKLEAAFKVRETAFEKNIDKETDAYHLTTLGWRLARYGEFRYAKIALNKAIAVDPAYRDGWVFLAWTLLENEEPQEALVALEQAEKLDPINIKTYELLARAAKALGNQEKFNLYQTKLQFLNK